MDWAYLESLLRIREAEAVWPLCERFALDCGFNHYSFLRKSSDIDVAAHVTRHNYRGDWARRFDGLLSSDAELTDPVLLHVIAEQPPTAWNSHGQVTVTRPDIHRRARRILGGVAEFGIRGGITIPLPAGNGRWCYMGVTTADTADQRELLPHLSSVFAFAHFLQGTLRRLGPAPLPQLRLTRRETEVLRWAAIGKSSWETSQILRIAESTVNFHIRSVIRRLNVRGRRAAVARALSLGLITL